MTIQRKKVVTILKTLEVIDSNNCFKWDDEGKESTNGQEEDQIVETTFSLNLNRKLQYQQTYFNSNIKLN